MKALLLILLFCPALWGAVNLRHTQNKKLNKYLSDGVFVGGEIGKGFSLLNIRREFVKSAGVERVILDMGDLNGQPLAAHIPYYHISIDKNKNILEVNLSQVQSSGVDEKKLKGIFSRSPLVKSAELRFDPEDLTTHLILKLKPSVAAEVFNMTSKDKASRIVLDLRVGNKK